jgi:hypothetical protein
MRYWRTMVERATYFFTVNLPDRSSRLLADQVSDLRKVARHVRRGEKSGPISVSVSKPWPEGCLIPNCIQKSINAASKLSKYHGGLYSIEGNLVSNSQLFGM